MIFEKTTLSGVWLIKPKLQSDERGYFSRTYCYEEFLAMGISFRTLQESISFNYLAKTLRGMHFQKSPAQEQKLVRCSQGEIFDVALDLRKHSSTFGQWFAAILSAKNHHALFIPQGVAHGFMTLQDNCEVFYLIDVGYEPELSAGVRWDDPAFSIMWPHTPIVIAEKDKNWERYER